MKNPKNTEAEMVKGGYYLTPRKKENSDIAHEAPCVRETWDWLIRNANFQDGFKNGRFLKRGQLFISIDGIREGLHWFKGWQKQMYTTDQVKKALTKHRTKHRIQAPQKAPGGMIITICNYDFYQTPENYESTTEGTIKAPLRHQEGTGTLSKTTDDEALQGLQKKERKGKKEKYISIKQICDFYLSEISPGQMTKQRALKNIEYHLKKHSFDDLRKSIENYKSIALTREPTFRKDPANFFGKQEPAFVDYLPENFVPATRYQPPPRPDLEELLK